MGGDITARSGGPGQGAVFTVTLMLAPHGAATAITQGTAHG
jgi:signal transduction histidine kinase